MASGWFTVSRQLLDSDLWLAEQFSRGQAWVDLIGLARFEAGHIRIKGYRIDLERGQLAWSEGSLAKRWKWSRGKVRRFLGELETDQRIEQLKSHVTSVITVKNYSLYQSPGTTNGVIPSPANGTSGGIRNNKGNKLTKKTTSSSLELSEEFAGTRAAWEGVEETLEKHGVSAAGQAITAAKARGVSPADIEQLVDEYEAKPGAWAAGALYSRVVGTLAAWPQPDEEFQRDQQRQAKAAASTVANQRRARVDIERAAERSRMARLERNHGADLDAMSDVDRAGLLAVAIPDPSERKMTGKNMARLAMLERLDKTKRKAAIA